MKYEIHKLGGQRVPLIFRSDEMYAGQKDFTHWHENLEILFFREGKGQVITDFSYTETDKDDFFVINSEKLHMVESADERHPVRYNCLIIDAGFCAENGIPVTELVFEDKITGDDRLKDLFMTFLKAYHSEDPFKEAKIRISVLNLLLYLSLYHLTKEERDEKEKMHLSNVREAIKYIRVNFDKPILADDVAKAAGLSKAYFSRIFKDVTGYTVVSYINLVRCRTAYKLLRSKKYKVKEVASMCGFENMSYFSKTYSQIMGKLPSEE